MCGSVELSCKLPLLGVPLVVSLFLVVVVVVVLLLLLLTVLLKFCGELEEHRVKKDVLGVHEWLKSEKAGLRKEGRREQILECEQGKAKKDVLREACMLRKMCMHTSALQLQWRNGSHQELNRSGVCVHDLARTRLYTQRESPTHACVTLHLHLSLSVAKHQHKYSPHSTMSTK
jgi:hypothetical protein